MRNLFEKAKEILGKTKPFFKKVAEILEPIKAFINKNNEIFKPIFVLTAICLIIAAALSLTNSLTEAKIAKITEENKTKEMSAILPAKTYLQVDFKLDPTKEDANFSMYKAMNGEQVEGYIITTSAKGYGGEIVVMTAFDSGSTIKAVSILNADNETPGLGQNVTTEAFTSQFKGVNNELVVVKTAPDNMAGEIKAVTGATISSKGTISAVNTARNALEEFLTLPSNKSIGGGTNE